jgi:hypothetical protein
LQIDLSDITHGLFFNVSIISGCAGEGAPCDVAVVVHINHMCTIKHFAGVEYVAAGLTAVHSLVNETGINAQLFDAVRLEVLGVAKSKRGQTPIVDFDAW